MVLIRGMTFAGGLRVVLLIPLRLLIVLKADDEVDASENKALSSRPVLADLPPTLARRLEAPSFEVSQVPSSSTPADDILVGVPGDSLRALEINNGEAGLFLGSRCPAAPGSVLAGFGGRVS